MCEGVRHVDHFGEDITMDKIKIAITGRVASVMALPEVVADNAEYEVDFALDPREGWDVTLPITALFVRRDGSYTPRILDAGATSCTMPPQTGTNIVYVGLTQDDMRTTTPATIKVRRSIRTVANDPLPAPTEDVYAQILAAYAGIKILSGKGAPTTETAGKVNQMYRDETNNRLYVCVNDDSGYTWAIISGSGGGGAAVTIDTTLTKSGQAADAKAAGDAIEKKLDKTALPTAINDALAQAKASGEFDGAKGEKGEKGDPGPAGPKGADGKDGAGMDVTGAKVGQIAKITAVDAAGKPTAWEPVDMPSGETYTLPIASQTVLGGVKPIAKTDAMTQGVGVDAEGALWTAAGGGNAEKWVKIVDYELTETEGEESPQAITFSKTPDNTTLAGMGIKKIIFAGRIKPTVTPSYAYGTFFVNDKSIRVGQNFGIKNTGDAWFGGKFELIGDGHATAEWTNGTFISGSIGGQAGIIINPHYYGANTPDIADDYNLKEITKIKITVPNDAKIATARLIVYGVKV